MKSEFYVIFMYHEIFSLNFVQMFENVETILSCLIIQKSVGQIRPAGFILFAGPCPSMAVTKTPDSFVSRHLVCRI